MASRQFDGQLSAEHACHADDPQGEVGADYCGTTRRGVGDGKAVQARGTVRPHETRIEANRGKDRTSLPQVPGYEIIEEIGRGSMGVVYKARQIDLGRLVALKMILGGHRANEDALQRFIAEARVISSLKHSHIVQIYEIRLQEDSPFFSMELVDGGTLADRLKGCPQPFRCAAHLVLTVARAVQVAHENGIVHRDLKPANILLVSPTPSNSQVQRMARELGLDPPDLGLGMPKITDFGLAKQLHTEGGRTESGMIMGTPSYMAPEQAEGKSSAVGPTADIYSLGAILYEMLTGRPPFTAESPLETVMQLFQMEPVLPSHLQPKIPRNLETICLKCLQKEPHRRYAGAEELADDLQRFLTGEPILARPASLQEKVWKWTRRRPAVATLIACSALAVVSLLGLALWHQVDLQARLGQALADERTARTAQMESKVKELLNAGEAAVAIQDWRNAHLQLTRARDQAGSQPELAALRARVEHLLEQTTQRQRDQERVRRFVQLRNHAFFHATLFTGTDRESALRETRSAALEALALFGIAPDTTTAPAVDSRYLDARKKVEIVADCYELLLVLAEAVARPLPGSQASAPHRHAEEALQILDRAAHLGITTSAFHRRRARYLVQAGRAEDAKQESLRAEALAPSTALDHFLLGEEQYHQSDYKQATLAFENVLQQQPDHFWASYYLALCELKTHHPDQAVARLTACVSWRPDFPWSYLLRASAWGELGQFPRAEADFQAALQARLPDSAHYGLLINRGVLRIRQGLLESAMDDLKQAVALRPEQYQAYVNLAQADLQANRLDEALEQIGHAIRREPALAALYRTRARVYLLQQNEKAALADLDRALRLEAGTANPAVAEDHIERGRLLYAQKDYQRALDAYTAALALRPQDARTSRLRAETLLELKRLPEALQALDHCLNYGPPDAGVFRARAALRCRLGQYPGAQTDFTRALEREPDAATYAARGWCYLVADAATLALADFEEAIRLAPEQGDAYAGRGFSRAVLGKHRLAVTDAEEALRRGPPSPRLYYNVARIYAQAVARLEYDPRRTYWTAQSWQDRAVQLLAHALSMQPAAEAARFWHEAIDADKALNPIRRSLGFRQLAVRYPSSEQGARPGDRRASDPLVESVSRSAVQPEP